jgi:hypothetical protein
VGHNRGELREPHSEQHVRERPTGDSEAAVRGPASRPRTIVSHAPAESTKQTECPDARAPSACGNSWISSTDKSMSSVLAQPATPKGAPATITITKKLKPSRSVTSFPPSALPIDANGCRFPSAARSARAKGRKPLTRRPQASTGSRGARRVFTPSPGGGGPLDFFAMAVAFVFAW